MWIVKSQCFAVACNPGSSACDPEKISDSVNLNSIYFPVTMTKHSSVGVAIPHGNDDDGGAPGDSADSANSADSAPVANAGPDVNITFPDKTSVILDGGLSTDDKVVLICRVHVHYMWRVWLHACTSHHMCRVWCTISGS